MPTCDLLESLHLTKRCMANFRTHYCHHCTGLTGDVLPPAAFQRSVSSSVRRASIETRTQQKYTEMASPGYIQMIDSYEKNFDMQLRVFIQQLVYTARSSTKKMYVGLTVCIFAIIKKLTAPFYG